MESALKELKEMQDRAEKKYMEWEDERWKREVEIEERRRREDRKHERMLFEMMCGAPQPPIYTTYSLPYTHPSTYSSQYNDNEGE